MTSRPHRECFAIDPQQRVAFVAFGAPRQFEGVAGLGDRLEFEGERVPPEPVVRGAVELFRPVQETAPGCGGGVIGQRSGAVAQHLAQFGEKLAAVEDMGAGMNGEEEIGFGVEHPVSALDFRQRQTAGLDRETAGGALLPPQLAHQQPGRNAGENVGELKMLLESRKVKAGAMAVLHVGNGGEPAAAAGHSQSFVQRRDVHRGFAAERQPRHRQPGGVHLGQTEKVVHATQGVPSAFAHERPIGVLKLVLAHVRRNHHTSHLAEGAPVPIQPLTPNHLLAAAAVTVEGQHRPHFLPGLSGPGEPDVGAAVGQRLQGELLEHNPLLGNLDALDRPGLQRAALGFSPAHHELEQFGAGRPLPGAGRLRVPGFKPKRRLAGGAEARPAEQGQRDDQEPEVAPTLSPGYGLRRAPGRPVGS